MSWLDRATKAATELFAETGSKRSKKAAADAMPGKCPQPKIVRVGFTDKPKKTKHFRGMRKQYVNLSNDKIVAADRAVKSKNQLGNKPPIHVQVKPPQAAAVRVKLTRRLRRGRFPANSHKLSTREQGLSHLKWESAEKRFTTNAKGELLIEPGSQISALAGGYYRVHAALPGKGFVRSRNVVRVMRRIYVRPVLRYRSGSRRALGAISKVRRQLGKLDIELSSRKSARGTELGVCERSTLRPSLTKIGRDALASTKRKVRDLRPHSVAIIAGEFITKASSIKTVRLTMTVRRNARGKFPTRITMPVKYGGKQYVVLPLSDGTQFVSGAIKASGSVNLALTARDVTGLTRFSRKLKVNLAGASSTRFSGKTQVDVELQVKAIRAWAVGWAYTSHPVIYLNMRDPNTNGLLTTTKAQALVVHELGHKLHLAASGAANQPDKQSTYYPSFNSHGVKHQGPHCKDGVPSGTALWKKAAHNAASCTMWGSLKGIIKLCDKCKTTLRKVNLSGGF